MRKLLVFQHVPHEILGTLNPLLKRAGFRIRYINFGRHPEAEPSLEGYHGLVVLGGPMSAYNDHSFPHLITEMKLIEDAMRRKLPVLGICLGAQLIAKTRRDPLLAEFREKEKIFQWHGDTFDIPHSSVHLASSVTCGNQAFRYETNVYAFQFHLEVDEPMILRWLKVPENRKEISSLHGDIDPDHIHAETFNYIERLHKLSDYVFSEFIKLFGTDKTLRRSSSG
jgi:GMP synthase (glutamine-hydrolysing)